MKTKTAVLNGKPDAGNPHVRFDEGEVASAKPRRGSLLYRNLKVAWRSLCGTGVSPVRALALVAVVGWAFTALADIPASAYVQDGLVVQFDGIENAGTGTYDATATIWTDLTGNGRNGTLSGKTAWNGKGLSITSASSSDKGLVTFDATHNASFTFDICLKVDKANGQYARITADNATPAMCCYGKGSSLTAAHPYVYGPGPGDDKDIGTAEYDATVLHTSTLLQSGDKADGWVWYHDGALLAQSSCVQTSTGSATATLGNRSSDYARGLNGTYYAVRIYNRALSADEIAVNANIDKIRFEGADPSELDWPTGCRWNAETGKIECRVTAECRGVAGSTVALNGGAAAKSASYWAEYGSTLSIVLTPAAGTSLIMWEGGAPEEGGTAGTYTVKVTSALSLAAVCGNETKTWAGASGARWDDESCWDPQGVPAAGDVVLVPAGSSVLLDGLTAHLGFADIAGTVTCTNWTTCIEADTLIVRKSGKVTCAGPVKTERDMSRAYLKGVDIVVEAGGSVDVTGKGFKGGEAGVAGYGPGAMREGVFGGSAHGGHGSYYILTQNNKYLDSIACAQTNIYGKAAAPETAGSGGWGGSSGTGGGAGGGVIRIVATGRVTVNGKLLATGGGSGGSGSACGSGGSVYVSCQTFAGQNGAIKADAVSPFTSYSQNYHGSGGGRIAIVFDTVEQAKLPVPRGMLYSSDCSPFHAPSRDSWTQAEPGTLYFSSDALIDRSGAALFGKLDFADVTDTWTVDSFRLTNGWAMLARDLDMVVTGDMEVSGKTLTTRRFNSSANRSTDDTNGTRWDVGGSQTEFTSNAVTYRCWQVSTRAPKLTVGGNLTVISNGLVHLVPSKVPRYPLGQTPATTNVGVEVSVTGVFKMDENGRVYSHSHPWSGTSPSISSGALQIGTTSWIDANEEGYSSVHGGKVYSLVPSTPKYKMGGSHGGAGGWSTNDSNQKYNEQAAPYDDCVWPVLPGGGGSGSYQGYYSRRGGGVIRLFVTGDAIVRGELRANAGPTTTFAGSGAGGSILLDCRSLSGAGVFSACGTAGHVQSQSFNQLNGAGGAGGRIAVHYDSAAQAGASAAFTFKAAGGAGVGEGAWTGAGESGSLWFTDDKLIAGNTTFAHQGFIYDPDPLSRLEMPSLNLTGGLISLPPGGYVDVAGDVVVSGSTKENAGFDIPNGWFRCGGSLTMNGGHLDVTGGGEVKQERLTVGGDMTLSGASVTLTCADTDYNSTACVGGTLTMTNKTTLTLQSPCAAVEGEPGLVFTAGGLEMYENCWVYPYSHNTNGASVLFRIPVVKMAPSSGFNASAKGYGRLTATGSQFGPQTTPFDGRAVDGNDGRDSYAPGHGGTGGLYRVVSTTYPRGRGLPYDSRRKPVLPGCGGSCTYQGNVPPRGGGVVRIESQSFDLNGGSLLADGGDGPGFRTGGSGGTVYVRAYKFRGGGGLLSAKGGNGADYSSGTSIGWCMSGGGGGRIAIWTAGDDRDVTTNVAGGNCPYKTEPMHTERCGTEGTVYWGALGGLLLFVR